MEFGAGVGWHLVSGHRQGPCLQLESVPPEQRYQLRLWSGQMKGGQRSYLQL